MDFKTAVAKLFAAGFKGQIRRTIETVGYPGGSYEHDYITLSDNPDGSGDKLERYTTDLFIRYPEVTIQEATRIGLIDPKNAAPVVEDPASPVPLVDVARFNTVAGVKYFASTAAGLSKPFNARADVGGVQFMKVPYPRVSFADPTEGWMQL